MLSSFFFEGDGVALLANDSTSAEINSTPNFTLAEGFEGRLVALRMAERWPFGLTLLLLLMHEKTFSSGR